MIIWNENWLFEKVPAFSNVTDAFSLIENQLFYQCFIDGYLIEISLKSSYLILVFICCISWVSHSFFSSFSKTTTDFDYQWKLFHHHSPAPSKTTRSHDPVFIRKAFLIFYIPYPLPDIPPGMTSIYIQNSVHMILKIWYFRL